MPSRRANAQPHRRRGRGRLVRRRLADHPGEHGVEQRRRALGGLGEARGQRAPGRGEPALGCDRVEHLGGLGRGGHPPHAAEDAAGNLAQPDRPRRRAQPGGHEHEQRRPAARAGARVSRPSPPPRAKRKAPAGEHGGEDEARRDRLALRSRQHPGQREPGGHRREQEPRRCSTAAARRQRGGRGHRPRVEPARGWPRFVAEAQRLRPGPGRLGESSAAAHARSPRRYTSTCTVLANAAQASRPASVSASASARADLDARPGGRSRRRCRRRRRARR